MPIINYPFNNTDNYNKDDNLIEVTGGVAKLKLIEVPGSYLYTRLSSSGSTAIDVSGNNRNGTLVSYNNDNKVGGKFIYNVVKLTRISNIVKVNINNHNFNEDDFVIISGAVQPEYNGKFVVTSVLDKNNFNYVLTSTPDTPATGTITAQKTGLKGIDDSTGYINFGNIANFDNTDSFSLECWLKYEQYFPALFYYKLDETTGLIANDVSGRSNDATLNNFNSGVVHVPGKINNGIKGILQRVKGNITVDDSNVSNFTKDDKFSIEFWIKFINSRESYAFFRIHKNSLNPALYDQSGNSTLTGNNGSYQDGYSDSNLITDSPNGGTYCLKGLTQTKGYVNFTPTDPTYSITPYNFGINEPFSAECWLKFGRPEESYMYISFDDYSPIGDIAKDISGNNRNGTNTGFTTGQIITSNILNLPDVISLNITQITGDGVTVTVTIDNTYNAGETVQISDTTSFNGTYVISSANDTQFTYSDSTTGTETVGTCKRTITNFGALTGNTSGRLTYSNAYASFEYDDPFSIEFWFKIVSIISGNAQYIVSKAATPSSAGFFVNFLNLGAGSEPEEQEIRFVMRGTTADAVVVQLNMSPGVSKSVTNLQSTGTTATATVATHGYSNGDVIRIRGAVQQEYNGSYVITSTGVNTFTYTFAGSGTSPATGTILSQKVGYTLSAGKLTSSGNTANVEITNHGYQDGYLVRISGATQTEYNGDYIITVVDTNNFTYQFAGSGTSPATGTITAYVLGYDDGNWHHCVCTNDGLATTNSMNVFLDNRLIRGSGVWDLTGSMLNSANFQISGIGTSFPLQNSLVIDEVVIHDRVLFWDGSDTSDMGFRYNQGLGTKQLPYSDSLEQTIMSKNDGSGWLISIINAQLKFVLQQGTNYLQTITNYDVLPSGEGYADNTWRHFTFTYDGSNLTSGINIYLNELLETTQVKSSNGTITSLSNTANFQISGKDGSKNCLSEKTRVCDFLIYARKLTIEEIQYRYNGGSRLSSDFTPSVPFQMLANKTNDFFSNGYGVILQTSQTDETTYLYFYVNDGSNTAESYYDGDLIVDLNDNKYHHIVCIYHGNGNTSMYVDNDNTDIVNTPATLNNITNTKKFQISGFVNDITESVSYNDLNMHENMIIDECVLYDYALTSEQVNYRWNSGNGRQELQNGNGYEQVLISKLNSSGKGYGLKLLNNKIVFELNDGVGSNIATSTKDYFIGSGNEPVDGLNLVIVWYNQATNATALNVNNVADTVNFASVNSITNTANFQITGYDGANSSIIDTTIINDCLVYDRIIQPAELNLRWNSGNGTQDIPGISEYPQSSPIIKPKLGFITDLINSITITEIISASDNITYIFYLDGVPYWYNTGWEISNETVFQSTDSTTVIANIQSLIIPSQPKKTIIFGAFITSDDGTTTPQLDLIEMNYDQPIPPPPSDIDGDILRMNNNIRGGFLIG